MSVLCPLTALAQSSLRSEADNSADYLSSLSQLFHAANRIAPDMLSGDGPVLRITPDGAVNTADKSLLSKADRELADAARSLFTLFRAMGGQPGKRALLLQRTRNGLFAAQEGSAGTLSRSVNAALGGALQAMARSDTNLPPAIAAWLPGLASAMNNPGAPPPAFPVARIERNRRTVITLTGPDIARAGPDAILAGPPGSSINILRNDGGSLLASVIFSGETEADFSKLYLYRASDALTPVRAYDVAIAKGGEAAAQAEPDDHGASPLTATPLLQAGAARASGKGQIGGANDVDMFTLRVITPGSLAITSRGSSDVTARLLDRNGNPVASNDDGGAGYNFGMRTQVAPGNYLLSVQHCCGGNGAYQIDTELTPR